MVPGKGGGNVLPRNSAAGTKAGAVVGAKLVVI